MSSEKLVVIGQGYVGLPLSMRAVEAGFQVVGLEVDPMRADSLAQGTSYVEDVTSAELRQALATNRFTASADYATAEDFDFAVITVPTPLTDGLPDLSYIERAGRALGTYLTRGATVVLESTTYPGTTEELLKPLLEEVSGLVAGADFHLGYSPERIDPGNKTFSLHNTPKVVSGLTDKCAASVENLYARLVHTTVPVSGIKEAELTKLLENTFRHVNIALVNELAIFAHDLGIDVWESIDAASTKPFGYMRFTPGPGVGGHCLPVDPSYLSWQVKRQLGHPFRFVELANDVNDHMPDHVVRRITAILNSQKKSVRGSRILLLGLAYKKNTGDARESPSLSVVQLLLNLGAELHVVDPHVDVASALPGDLQIKQVELSSAEVGASDVVVLLVDHDEFDLSILEGARVFDTKRALTSSSLVETL